MHGFPCFVLVSLLGFLVVVGMSYQWSALNLTLNIDQYMPKYLFMIIISELCFVIGQCSTTSFDVDHS